MDFIWIAFLRITDKTHSGVFPFRSKTHVGFSSCQKMTARRRTMLMKFSQSLLCTWSGLADTQEDASW